MSVVVDGEKIKNLLERGVEDVFVKENIEQKLMSGKQLRVKFGIDPTGTTIHLGRAVVLRKLKEFQDLGHKIVLIVGDFTAIIGDPSDKLGKRPMLSREEIKKNLENYVEIIGKIIDIKNTEITYNSHWLSKINFGEVSELAEAFSVQQMLARRNFKDRFEKGEEISLREFLYPLMQGYDSVAVKADVEIGGFDQIFNLKAGRTIERHYKMPEQDILTTMMLEGTDGRKMSTSWGNVINITDLPFDMFGKVMSVRDELIFKYFLLCTDVSAGEIKSMEEQMKNGANPKDLKLRLASEIVAIYHGKDMAGKAAEQFGKTFSDKEEIPEDAKSVLVPVGTLLSELLIKEKIVSSKTDFRRLIESGSIKDLDSGEKISDPTATVSKNVSLRVGKHRFIKISIV